MNSISLAAFPIHVFPHIGPTPIPRGSPYERILDTTDTEGIGPTGTNTPAALGACVVNIGHLYAAGY
jgi:hypothetical protein